MQSPWYRPLFSNHWGNWLFVALSFMIGFLPVSAMAYTITDIDKGVYNSSSAALSACNAFRATAPHTNTGSCGFVTNTSVNPFGSYPSGIAQMYDTTAAFYNYWFSYIEGSCPNGLEPDFTGLCVEPVECPQADTELSAGIMLSNSNFSSGSIVVNNGDMSYNGCRVRVNYMAVECDQATIAADPSLASKGCFVNAGYVYTGESSIETDTLVPSQVTEEIPTNAEPVINTTASDTTDTTYGQEQTETLVDGTEVTSKTDVETEKRGSGVSVDNTVTDVQTVQLDGGITKTTTTTTVTTTNPDGSKTLVTTVQQSYTDWDIEQYKVDNGDGTVTYTNVPGAGTYTASKQTTDNYDASGNKTSSTSNSSVSGSPAAQDQQGSEEAGDYCTENPGAAGCVEWEASTDNNVAGFDTTQVLSDQEQSWADLEAIIDGIHSEFTQMFNFSGSGSSVLGCYALFDYNGTTYDMCLDDYASAFATIGNALFFIAMILGLAMIVRD